MADAAWEHPATLFMEAELHHEHWGIIIRWSDLGRHECELNSSNFEESHSVCRRRRSDRAVREDSAGDVGVCSSCGILRQTRARTCNDVRVGRSAP